MSAQVIQVRHIGKRYQIGARERYHSLRDTLTRSFTAPVRWLKHITRPSNNGSRVASTTLWALRDINFDVHAGEVVGVVGRNGAGKSTLLKVLSRITEPTEGRIELHGRVGSLLEVGTGFHPELTGRENIYLNGAILGMSKAEITRKFDEIVAFAEVEPFLDTVVKHYSSGMYMRLAFGVAAHLDPDILLVDEVLAVGDMAFQKKCLGKMEEVAKAGRTVLLVSHNMGAIRGLCSRAIMIEAGQLAADGSPDEVIAKYLGTSGEAGFELNTGHRSNDPLVFTKVLLRNRHGETTTEFNPGDALTVEICFHAQQRIEQPHFWIGILSQYGPLITASQLFDGRRADVIEGDGIIRCTFHSLPLLPQTYTLRIGARAANGATPIAATQEAGFFSISGRMRDYGLMSENADSLAWEAAPVLIPYTWQMPDGQSITVQGFTASGKTA